jgi:hypothetical protein
MWFDKSMDDVWVNGFYPAIRAARFRPAARGAYRPTAPA